jgi:hypothetical protein
MASLYDILSVSTLGSYNCQARSRDIMPDCDNFILAIEFSTTFLTEYFNSELLVPCSHIASYRSRARGSAHIRLHSHAAAINAQPYAMVCHWIRFIILKIAKEVLAMDLLFKRKVSRYQISGS